MTIIESSLLLVFSPLDLMLSHDLILRFKMEASMLMKILADIGQIFAKASQELKTSHKIKDVLQNIDRKLSIQCDVLDKLLSLVSDQPPPYQKALGNIYNTIGSEISEYKVSLNAMAGANSLSIILKLKQYIYGLEVNRMVIEYCID